jgi:hypothetical protein
MRLSTSFSSLRVPLPATDALRTIYSEDRERFFSDFADVFAKLLELGVERSGSVRSRYFSLSYPSFVTDSPHPDDSTTLLPSFRRKQARRKRRRRLRRCKERWSDDGLFFFFLLPPA